MSEPVNVVVFPASANSRRMARLAVGIVHDESTSVAEQVRKRRAELRRQQVPPRLIERELADLETALNWWVERAEDVAHAG